MSERRRPREGGAAELGLREFRVLAAIIREATGILLEDEKRELLAHRLRPVLAALGLPSYGALARALRDDPSGERLALVIDRATTNTTGFFRHRPHFDLLRERLPELLGARGRVRIWSVGCSSGEEPYSIALVLLATGRVHDAKVLATDLSRRALARARTGVYDGEALEAVPAEHRHWFQARPGGRFEVGPELRRLVHLRHHDLRRVSGAAAVFDAVFCRNVLIYFAPADRALVVARLTRALRPGGIFFLGPSEAGIGLPHGFARIGPTAYKKGEGA